MRVPVQFIVALALSWERIGFVCWFPFKVHL